MTTIAQYFEQAQLSLAAYALNLTQGVSGKLYTDALEAAGMTATQAATFASTYTVVDQYTDPLSGLSATVFDNGGVKYMAVRGTEKPTASVAGFAAFLMDVGTDINGVGGAGIAIDQGIAMFNYYLRATAVQGATIKQYDYLPALNGQPASISATNIIASADGILVTHNPDGSVSLDTFSVAGHSLGGHLAMLLSRLVPSAVASVSTFNAPGFGTEGQIALSFFDLLAQATTGQGQIGASWNPQIMTHLNVEGDAVHVLGSTPAATSLENIVFSENANQSWIDAHSMEAITDSLALYNLFATLDPSLNTNPAGLTKIGDILKASSNDAAKSLETTLGALGKVFGQTITTATDDRESYYANLNQVQALFNPAFSASYTVDSLANMDAATLVANASDPSNTAYRYALRELNSFAVVGTDYSSFNQNGELNLYDPATRTGILTGTITGQYLKDRSAFLADKTIANTQDNLSNGMGYVDYAGTKQYFRDESGATPTTVVLGGSNVTNPFIAQPPNDIQQIRFGSGSATDTLAGGTKNDHLYGMAGDDTLQGNGGNDYLEGGKGFDTYKYNAGDGSDIILDTDGQGIIMVDGVTLGAGKDTGDGRTYKWADAGGKEHTYLFLSGDAATGGDLLIDGSLTVKNFKGGDLGIALNAAQQTNPQATKTIYGDLAPKEFQMEIPGAPLSMPFMGAFLNADSPLGPANTAAIIGIAGVGQPDAQGNYNSYLYTYWQKDPATTVGGNYNFIMDAGKPVPGQADHIFGSNGNDHVESGGGNDVISFYSSAGDDYADAGAGNDNVLGGAGNDVIIGGAGLDMVRGGQGDDMVYADAQASIETAIGDGNTQTGDTSHPDEFLGNGEILSGDQDYVNAPGGDDTLVGGAGSDLLSGGGGSDLLIGGAGNDDIGGDNWFMNRHSGGFVDVNDPLYTTMQATRPFWVQNVFDPYVPTDGGADVIHAGNGDDFAWGDVGDDVIFGEGGADRLVGGSGADIVTGGSIKDIFQNASNTIPDTMETLVAANDAEGRMVA